MGVETINGWSLVYKKAVLEDGSLLFPERLTREFLDKARRTMGSYLFANQYQNEIIPEGEQTFKKHWIRYYADLPDRVNYFAFIDPAISEAATSDFTGIVVIAVDTDQNWYVPYASRQKLNPSQLIDLVFKIHDRYKCQTIGIEDVAFQRAIIHFAFEEMKRRNIRIPITGVKRGNQTTKEMRILGLVPRFEWGTLFLAQGQHDLEMELSQFPRGSHDDILDALASFEEFVTYPQKLRPKNETPAPNSPEYESWFIKQLSRRQSAAEG